MPKQTDELADRLDRIIEARVIYSSQLNMHDGRRRSRRRTTANPLNRQEYMMNLARRATRSTNEPRETK